MSEPPRTSELGARAATERGETGDKMPGFDPAAAPMETDAEAGGAPSGGAAPAASPAAVTHRPPQTSTGSAMQAMPGVDTPRGLRGWRIALAGLLLVAIAVVAAVIAV